MVMQAWLERAADSTPAATAIEGPEGSLTYAQLLARARACAAELGERGAKPGARVAIALAPGVELATALHACLLAGLVAVPIDLRLSAAEREQRIAGCAVSVEEPLGGACAGEANEGEDAGAHRESIARARPGAPLSATHRLDAPALTIHTSGTTSAPKPVTLTYGNLLWSALGSAAALGVDPRERWLCALPLSHVGGLSILVRSAVYATTAVVHERFDVERMCEALGGGAITLVSLVPTMLARLLDAGLRNPPELRCALIGGGPVPPALLARARAAGVAACATYGLTECCSQAATVPVGVGVGEGDGLRPARDGGSAAEQTAGGAGVPLFCVRVEVADDGEILLSGPTVAPGALAEDGRLHSGDLGCLDELGRLHVSGRKADTIVTGGENVAPAEVEAAIEAHPEVLEAAVLGRVHPEWGEALEAIVVLATGSKLDEQGLREHCAGMLARFKIPKRFSLVSDPLPRTPSGKLLRRELR
jgi:o-succinylbenzoate---CoA ligase